MGVLRGVLRVVGVESLRGVLRVVGVEGVGVLRGWVGEGGTERC